MLVSGSQRSGLPTTQPGQQSGEAGALVHQFPAEAVYLAAGLRELLGEFDGAAHLRGTVVSHGGSHEGGEGRAVFVYGDAGDEQREAGLFNMVGNDKRSRHGKDGQCPRFRLAGKSKGFGKQVAGVEARQGSV